MCLTFYFMPVTHNLPMRHLVLLLCLLTLTWCTTTTTPDTLHFTQSEANLFSPSYVDQTWLNEWLDSNQWVITKQDIVVSWALTPLWEKLNTYWELLYFRWRQEIPYHNISFIFANNGESTLTYTTSLITSWTQESIVTSPLLDNTFTLVNIYPYTWDNFSGAIDMISTVQKMSTCEPTILSSNHMFSFRISNKDYKVIDALKDDVEQWREAAFNHPCFNGFEYYSYIRYPQLQKIFGVIRKGKQWWDLPLLQFIGIRNSSWEIEIEF